MKKLFLLFDHNLKVAALLTVFYGCIVPLAVLGQPKAAVEITRIEAVSWPQMELFPSISPDGEKLYFTSAACSQPWSVNVYSDYKGVRQCDGDIYCTQLDSSGVYQSPQVLGQRINTSQMEGEVSIQADGQTVYYQSWAEGWKEKGGPYYSARLDGGIWGERVGLGPNIAKFLGDIRKKADSRRNAYIDAYFSPAEAQRLKGLLHTDFAGFKTACDEAGFGEQLYRQFTQGGAISPHGDFFVFAAQDFEVPGINYELYISSKGANGMWSVPEAMTLNTPSDEYAPFIAADGRSIYFSSNRGGGYGGFDIYRSVWADGKWGEAANIGKPYNTGGQETGLAVSAVGGIGVLVRDGDLYKATLNELTEPTLTTVIKGRVFNYKEEPVSIEVRWVDTKTKEVIGRVKSNSATGKFLFARPRQPGDFELSITTWDLVGIKKYFKITEDTPNPLTIDIEIPFMPYEGERLKTFNIAFGADSAELRSKMLPVLDEVAGIFLENPDCKLKIHGHTNNLPPVDYCDRLSFERAKAVYGYLVQASIPSEKMDIIGHGKEEPMASNATYQGRKQNQRVEIEVIRPEAG